MKKLFLVAMALAVASVAHAEPVLKAFAGVNGAWYSSPVVVQLPSDFEFGANARASLSPHISGVGGAYFGTNHSYLRGSGGLRFTLTDAENPDLSLGLGIQYHFSSEPDLRPEQWVPDASLGWRPSPINAPKLTVIAQAGYGLDDGRLFTLAGLRYQIWEGAPR